jgi:hypothetical protein
MASLSIVEQRWAKAVHRGSAPGKAEEKQSLAMEKQSRARPRKGKAEHVRARRRRRTAEQCRGSAKQRKARRRRREAKFRVDQQGMAKASRGTARHRNGFAWCCFSTRSMGSVRPSKSEHCKGYARFCVVRQFAA